MCAWVFFTRPQSHLSLSNRGDSGQTSRERLTLLDRTLIEQLDAAIDRKMFYDDFLETPTITRPLPDKVTKRDFDTHAPPPQDVDLSAFDFEPLPVTQKDIAHQAKTSQQISTLDPVRYSSMVKCVDCGFFDEKGVECLVHGEIALPDTPRACDAFSVKYMCAWVLNPSTIAP